MEIPIGKIYNPPTKAILVHLFCWLIFIFYELSFLYFSGTVLESPMVYAFYYSVNILFFYLFIGVLNTVFSGKEYAKGILFLVLLFIGILSVKFLFSTTYYHLHFNFTDQSKELQKFLISTFYRTGYYATLASFYWVAGHIAFYRKQLLESEKQELIAKQEKSTAEIRLSETRNAYLQQQINPHMLFNALNFIYNSVYKHSPEASRSVLLLSDMMRYSLEAAGPDNKTLLENEVEQIHNLIEINRQRYDEPLFLKIEISQDLKSYRILPLILFTLTENLFKHGNLKMEKHPALLRIHVNEKGELSYYTRNLKKSVSEFQRNSQIGLQNIRTRMDFTYFNRYSLTLLDQDGFFETTLNVNL